MYQAFKDFRNFAEPFILKIEYSDSEVILLRYQEWADGIDFANVVHDYFGSEVSTSYMTETYFKQYVDVIDRPEWLSLIEDVKEDA